MKKLAGIEFIRGFCATIALYCAIRLYAIPIALLCGLLWMLGGTYLKSIRRLGIPIIVWLAATIIHGIHTIYILTPLLGLAILSLGDGFPDAIDDGSWLGRLVNRFIHDEGIGGAATKWLIVLLFQLALLPIFLS